jgi:hypothetical protein
MVLAFNSGGDYARTVYGDSNSQHAGANGAIATTPPSGMKGGKRNKSQRNNQKRGGKSQRNKSRRNNKSQRNKRNQRGGK